MIMKLRPYFKTPDNVREGAFSVANKLYGITFTPITAIPASPSRRKGILRLRKPMWRPPWAFLLTWIFFTRNKAKFREHGAEKYRDHKMAPMGRKIKPLL